MMKIIDYLEENSTKLCYSHYISSKNPDGSFLFFDIETTGFSPKNTTLYLIGALWYESDGIHIRQWFNEDGYSEKELLSAFEQHAKAFTHLVHFNGLGFDLPYLREKAKLLQTAFSLDEQLYQMDILKEIRSYKALLSLENLKQVTIEKYLGIERTDTYSGGELINIYQRYVARPDSDKEQLLLLHNHDDLLGMPQISHILNYKAFFEQIEPANPEIKADGDFITIYFEYQKTISLPKRLICTRKHLHLNALDGRGCLTLPIYKGTLKHFFSDYKQYYYLPLEDMAVHKSVAAFVDTQNKKKATKSTCYIKKTDAFVPCFDSQYSQCFRMDFKDKATYQTLDSILTGTVIEQCTYISQALSAIASDKRRSL